MQTDLRRGSPYIPIEMPALAAGAIQTYEIESSPELAEGLEYAPLDYLQIVNHDDVDLRLTFDQKEWFLIPSGVIDSWKWKPWRRIDIKNLGAVTTTLGKVVINVRRMAAQG